VERKKYNVTVSIECGSEIDKEEGGYKITREAEH
jgi:hypothetical protein